VLGTLPAATHPPRAVKPPTAEERDDIPPLHSITWSAATIKVCGTVRPSIRAV
jgi:hypothetical protein